MRNPYGIGYFMAPKMEIKMKIAFIGLGIMGSRMAANLQKSGFYLILHNRTRDKANLLLANGATWADTPAGAARQADLLLTMLSTPEAVTETAMGENGFLSQLKPGAIWVDCTTVNPSFSCHMAALAQARGVQFVDAPVGGSKDPAEKGQLLFFVGGRPEDVAVCQPLFSVMGRQTFHLGDIGMGASMKMVFNSIMGASMLVFCEAMALGQSLGLSQKTLLDTLSTTPIMAPFITPKKAKFESGQYDVEFPLQWLRKDLHLATTSAYEQNLPLPLLNAAKEVYTQAMRAGFSGEDYSAIYAFVTGKKKKELIHETMENAGTTDDIKT